MILKMKDNWIVLTVCMCQEIGMKGWPSCIDTFNWESSIIVDLKRNFVSFDADNKVISE